MLRIFQLGLRDLGLSRDARSSGIPWPRPGPAGSGTYNRPGTRGVGRTEEGGGGGGWGVGLEESKPWPEQKPRQLKAFGSRGCFIYVMFIEIATRSADASGQSPINQLGLINLESALAQGFIARPALHKVSSLALNLTRGRRTNNAPLTSAAGALNLG